MSHTNPMNSQNTSMTRVRVVQCDCNPGKTYASTQSFQQHLTTHRHEAFALKERCRDLQRRLQAMEMRWKTSTHTIHVLRRKCDALENALTHLEVPDGDEEEEPFEDAMTTVQEER